MNICYFGTYEKNFPRNRVFINALKQIKNVNVIECHFPLWEKTEDKTGSYFSFTSLIKIILYLVYGYLKLILCYLSNVKKIDVVIVGYIGQLDMFIAKFLNLFFNKKIIFNPMVSLYDTIILDRGIIKQESWKAYLLKLLDRFSCKFADKVVLDTDKHADYFAREFNIERKKFHRIFIGADEKLFYPIKKLKKSKNFIVLFYGKFTPLHGIEYILRCAKLLEDYKNIKFKIVGSGQMYNEMMNLYKKLKLKNIEFVNWVEYKNLKEEIAKADICLGGHFGKGGKATRVIASKVFQMLAMKKPVIVGKSKASDEGGFINKLNCIICKIGEEKDLAKSILILRNNPALRIKIGNEGYNLFKNKFSTKRLKNEILKLINEVNNGVV